MRAATLLGDLFENPPAALESILSDDEGFGVTYNRDLYDVTRTRVLLVQDGEDSLQWEASDRLYDVLDRYSYDEWQVSDGWGTTLPEQDILKKYDLVIWEQAASGTFDTDRQSLIADYLNGGGNVVLAGLGILSALDQTAKESFLGVLATQYVDPGTDAAAGFLTGENGTVAEGIPALPYDVMPLGGGAGGYEPEIIMSLVEGVQPVLTLGQGNTVALTREFANGGTLLFSAIPLTAFLPAHATEGQYYEVWGGNYPIYDQAAYMEPGFAGYQLLGTGTGTQVFSDGNSYSYVVIVVPENSGKALQLEGVEVLTGMPEPFFLGYPQYFRGTFGTDILDEPLTEPDQSYTYLNSDGEGGCAFFSPGSAIQIKVHCGPGTAWPWEGSNNIDTLLDSILNEFEIPILLDMPEVEDLTSAHPGINDTLDAFGTDFVGRIEQILPLLDTITGTGQAPTWSRTLTPDMLPEGNDGSAPVTVDTVDVLFAQSGLQMVQFVVQFFSAYELDMVYEDVFDDDWELTSTYWNAHDAFGTIRNSPAMADAKASLEGGLTDVRDGMQMLRDGWQGPGQVAAEAYDISPSDWDEIIGYVDDVLESLSPATANGVSFAAEGYDPVTINLEKLFSAPITRADVPDLVREDPGTPGNPDESLDWSTLPDATLNGLFPNWSRADFYARFTQAWLGKYELLGEKTDDWDWVSWYEDDLVLTADDNGYRLRWGAGTDEFWEYDEFVGDWVRKLETDDCLFEDYIDHFELYQRVSAPSDQQTAFELLQTVGTDRATDETAWAFTDAAADTLPTDAEWEYKVRIVFEDTTSRATAFLETPVLHVAQDTDGDRLADWWELEYTLTLDGLSGDMDYLDSDGDNLNNRSEFRERTNPLSVDTDGDGMDDALEAFYDLDPLTDDSALDLDGDGYANGLEVTMRLDPDWHLSSPARKPATQLVSAASDGTPAQGDWLGWGMPTHDDRRIFFTSNATALGADGMSSFLFVRDLVAGTTEMVNVSSTGKPSDGTSPGGGDMPACASMATGRYLAFVSNGTNLVPEVANEPAEPRLYLRDIDAQTTSLVAPLMGTMFMPFQNFAMTPDGATMVFENYDTQQYSQIYRYVTATGELTALTAVTDGMVCGLATQNTEYSEHVLYTRSLSSDGRYVFFTSDASGLVVGDTNDTSDIFVCDTESENAISRVSVGVDGSELANASTAIFYSASLDGRFVLFQTNDLALAGVDNDPPTSGNALLIRDVEGGTTSLVGVLSEYMMTPSAVLSSDGRFVVFEDTEENPDDGMGMDVTVLKVFDRLEGTTEIATLDMDGNIPEYPCGFASDSMDQAIGDSYTAYRRMTCLSSDGRFLFFRTYSNDMVPNDSNDRYEIFVRDLLYGTTAIVDVHDDPDEDVPFGDPWGMWSTFLWASADGRTVMFSSAEELVDDMPPISWLGLDGLYLRDLVTRHTFDITHPGTFEATGTSPRLSRSGALAIVPEYMWSSEGGKYVRQLYAKFWADTDQDLLLDRFEEWFGLDPHTPDNNQADADEDTLDLLQEQWAWTDPASDDTDGDALPDDWEVEKGLDPRMADADFDLDHDGHDNLAEFTANLNPTVYENISFLQLYTGWNMVSVPTSMAGVPCRDIFRSETLDAAWAWDPFRQQYENILDASAAKTLSDRSGYWVLVLEDKLLFFVAP